MQFRYDMGWNEQSLTGLIGYDCLLGKHTWELPIIKPTGTYTLPAASPAFVELLEKEVDGAREVVLRLTNKSTETAWINTITLAAVLPRQQGMQFRFPANVPHGIFTVDEMADCAPVEAGLANFCVALTADDARRATNILFIGTEEKWGTAVWRKGEKVTIAFCAAVEENLPPNASLELGTLYVQHASPPTQLTAVRDFVARRGYTPPTDGLDYSGVMYSCHPFGTMDAGFASLQEDLFAYAKRLPAMAAMGIKHVWLLPVFDHNEDGVYHSNDQAIIDARYGGEAACRHFCAEAARLGMTVLFDYVPHGPVPEHPLAANNPDWCSKRRDGSMHIEWNCVSMDYNHPGYLDYTRQLAADHVRRFGIQGARIDCAMGGLSNWRPRPGKRPSASSICAGVKISKAIRDGFLQEGVVPLSMPENFHPIPIYYPYTDVFYGFNLYRVLCEMEGLYHTDRIEYVRRLIAWLKDESELLPMGMGKLRFLGNHDTVSWVWQARRATAIYGTEGAKSLWVLFSLIDGMPMIYQGDEDPAQYSNPDGPQLTSFFTELFAHRNRLDAAAPTTYIQTGTALCVIERSGALILINLGDKEETYEQGKTYTVAPYGYQVDYQ